jgi:hypothetical protein
MHRSWIQKNHVAFHIFSRFIGDLSFENQIELSAGMLVLKESIGRDIGVNAIKHQFAPTMAREAGHRQPVAEVPPLELIQSWDVQFDANEILQRGV